MKNHYKNNIHLEPPKGLLNDPNGLTYFNGSYYVFHQWNRFGCDHRYKEWGLFTSSNLLDWEHRGSAILPDSQFDSHGVYSGSAIALNNQLNIFYTGNTKNNEQRKSYQCFVTSKDGQTFLKFGSISTPEGFTEHHRDPKVIYFDHTWYMIVGSQTHEYTGAIALYQSSDLENWQYQGIFFQDQQLAQMCECPDLLDFGSKQILLVCPQKRRKEDDTDISSYSGYYVGKVIDKKFINQSTIQPLDYGFDFYAPQTMKDEQGRYLMWAWMSRMSHEEEQTCPTQDFGYIHCLTLPRELTIKDGKLFQQPIKELLNQLQVIASDTACKLEFQQGDETLHLAVEFYSDVDNMYLMLDNGEVELLYSNKRLVLKRKSWVDHNYKQTSCPINKLRNLQIIIDQSAVEIFINDGATVMSLRYFPRNEIKTHCFICNERHQSILSKI